MTEVWPILQTVSPDGKAGDYDCLNFGQGEKRRGTGPDRERERAVQLGSKGEGGKRSYARPATCSQSHAKPSHASTEGKEGEGEGKGQSGHQR